jgi:hypothetical protein
MRGEAAAGNQIEFTWQPAKSGEDTWCFFDGHLGGKGGQKSSKANDALNFRDMNGRFLLGLKLKTGNLF